VGRYQKGKTNLDFTEARDSGSGISWAISKSASRSRQITMPAPHHSVFYRPDALSATNQQRQSTEGMLYIQHTTTYKSTLSKKTQIYLENLVFVRFKGMQFELQISKIP